MVSRRKFIGSMATISAAMIIPRHVLGGKNYVAPSDKINLGFIGAGRQAIHLRKSFIDTGEINILAVADVYGQKKKLFAEQALLEMNAKMGTASAACQGYDDFRQILGRKDIDAVVIAVPDHWHAAIAVRAAEAGKDIYCEKPLSLTVREGRAMVKATRKHDRVFQTGSMQRSWPEFRQTVELVRNGYIGDIKNIKVSVNGGPVPYNLPKEPVPADLNWDLWLGPNEYVDYNHELDPLIGDPKWAQWRYYEGLGGGDMTDWGAHMFDIVQWALDMDDSGPIQITPPDGKDVQHLTYQYKNGIIVTHEDFGKKHAIQFNGSEGVIEIQRGKLVTTPATLKDKVIGGNDKRVYYSDNHYKDFLNAMRKRTRPIADVEIGHRSATVCNIGNIAFAVKQPLQWDPKDEQFKHDRDANQLLSRKMKKEWAV